MKQAWEETALWGSLAARSNASEITAAIQPILKNAETWLAKGAVEDTVDFTLHDENHAARVAEWMIKLLPSGVLEQLSATEVALLLMAAYLHDIGMTPKRAIVGAVKTYIAQGTLEGVSEDRKKQTSEEISQLQKFLDMRGVSPGMLKNGYSAHANSKVNELTTDYCRARHNEWSKAWIEEFISATDFLGYESSRDDLVKLCQSHHWDLDRLGRDDFSPRHVSGSGHIVNLRYLSTILRIADILENDPERTPKVILYQRDIRPSSQLYWRKDHSFICHIVDAEVKTERRVKITAEPKNAVGHKAVLETSGGIVAELRIAKLFHDTGAFTTAVAERFEQYKWDLQDTLVQSISPRDGSYTYIEGSFRPNTTRLMEILAGSRFYGNPFHAIRELLQNSFDAVKEQQALERLEYWEKMNRPPKTVWSEAPVARDHVIHLVLENRGSDDKPELWLTCDDDGVGMDKRIIERHLLVSGSDNGGYVKELERRCEAAGFELERTGQFGIGALSYFMISDEVRIETRRSSLANSDGINEAWSFSTRGLDDFGELRKSTRRATGTCVEFRLRDISEMFPAERSAQLRASALSWFGEALEEYLLETLVRIPCPLTFTNKIKERTLAYGPGWVATEALVKDRLISAEPPEGSVGYSSPELRTNRADRFIERVSGQWKEVRRRALGSMRFAKTEGTLDGNVHFRIWTPYFEELDGKSLAFLCVNAGDEETETKEGSSLNHMDLVGVSWRVKGLRSLPSGAPIR